MSSGIKTLCSNKNVLFDVEMSHRSSEYKALNLETMDLLRDVLYVSE